MCTGIDDLEQVSIESAAALEVWLAVHYGQVKSVWLVRWKKGFAGYVGREEVLDALLTRDRIDGRRKVLDAERTMQLIAPRKQQAWSQSYKARVALLRLDGRMRPPDEAAFEAGRASGFCGFLQMWTRQSCCKICRSRWCRRGRGSVTVLPTELPAQCAALDQTGENPGDAGEKGLWGGGGRRTGRTRLAQK